MQSFHLSMLIEKQYECTKNSKWPPVLEEMEQHQICDMCIISPQFTLMCKYLKCPCGTFHPSEILPLLNLRYAFKFLITCFPISTNSNIKCLYAFVFERQSLFVCFGFQCLVKQSNFQPMDWGFLITFANMQRPFLKNHLQLPKLILAQDIEQRACKINKLNPLKKTKRFVATTLYNFIKIKFYNNLSHSLIFLKQHRFCK